MHFTGSSTSSHVGPVFNAYSEFVVLFLQHLILLRLRHREFDVRRWAGRTVLELVVQTSSRSRTLVRWDWRVQPGTAQQATQVHRQASRPILVAVLSSGLVRQLRRWRRRRRWRRTDRDQALTAPQVYGKTWTEEVHGSTGWSTIQRPEWCCATGSSARGRNQIVAGQTRKTQVRRLKHIIRDRRRFEDTSLRIIIYALCITDGSWTVRTM